MSTCPSPSHDWLNGTFTSNKARAATTVEKQDSAQFLHFVFVYMWYKYETRRLTYHSDRSHQCRTQVYSLDSLLSLMMVLWSPELPGVEKENTVAMAHHSLPWLWVLAWRNHERRCSSWLVECEAPGEVWGRFWQCNLLKLENMVSWQMILFPFLIALRWFS